MRSDYESNAALDTYSQADIDDNSDLAELTLAERRAAEREMVRRDRGQGGRRAGRREHMPAFFQSDDAEDGFGEGPLAGINVGRRRRQYDERMNVDDVEDEVGLHERLDQMLQGESIADSPRQEMEMEDLGDVKAASVAEWIGVDAVRRSIQKYFRSFLMTFLDEDGESMYGRKIQALGESTFSLLLKQFAKFARISAESSNSQL